MDRLEKIEVLVQQNAEAIAKLVEQQKEHAQEQRDSKVRFEAYQQATQWVVQLAFSLIVAATAITIVRGVLG